MKTISSWIKQEQVKKNLTQSRQDAKITQRKL